MGFFASMFGGQKTQETTTNTYSLQDSGNVALSRTLALDNVGNVSVNLPSSTPAQSFDFGRIATPQNIALIAGAALLFMAWKGRRG